MSNNECHNSAFPSVVFTYQIPIHQHIYGGGCWSVAASKAVMVPILTIFTVSYGLLMEPRGNPACVGMYQTCEEGQVILLQKAMVATKSV